MSDERREFQRLNLTRIVDGWFGDYAVRLRDVSAIGALMESEEPIEVGSRAQLRFFWRDTEVEITAEIARSADGSAGVHFLEESETLRELIVSSASELLRAQEANAMGLREQNVIAGDETLTAASAGARAEGFLTFTLSEAGWKRRNSLLPDQPPNGFTVSASEPLDQIDLLCWTYENGSAESRTMTRLLAELSASAVITH